MDHFSKVHTSNLVATTHSRFCFPNRISHFPKYRHIIPPFSGVGYESSFFYLTNPIPTLVLSPVIMHFTISFPILVSICFLSTNQQSFLTAHMHVNEEYFSILSDNLDSLECKRGGSLFYGGQYFS